jgi:hypothetical protein
LNKLIKLERSSEIDNMALMGILSSQIVHEIFVNDFKPDYAGMKNFDIVFDMRTEET